MLKIENKAMDEYNLISRIATRAEELGVMRGKRITLFMDLENAHETFNLRLDDLLNADDFNFSHDITGIQENINRLTKEFENSFVPRYAKKNDVTEKAESSNLKMIKKYKLTKEEEEVKGTTTKVYRIKAIRDFSDVKAGDLGGYVESEKNLSHEGDCWIYDNSKVFENAYVCQDAKVFSGAEIFGDAVIRGNASIYYDCNTGIEF